MNFCVLLSAGFSTRFGAPKALAQVGQTSVINYLLKSLLASDIDKILVVLGAHRDAIQAQLLKHKKVCPVYNKDYIFGQTSSFKVGLTKIFADKGTVFLMPVDYPLVRAETLNRLIAAHQKKAPLLTIPTFSGRWGHPPLFDLELRSELTQLPDEEGINQIAPRHRERVLLAPVPDRGVIQTFNTRDEFRILTPFFI